MDAREYVAHIFRLAAELPGPPPCECPLCTEGD